MTMNKKEQAAFDAFQVERDMARALRWPEYDKPVPMTYEEICAEIAAGNTVEFRHEFRAAGKVSAFVGWGYHFYQGYRLYKVAVTTTSRGMINDAGQAANWSRNESATFRTEADALRVLRHDMTVKYAADLAEIDAKIKGAS